MSRPALVVAVVILLAAIVAGAVVSRSYSVGHYWWVGGAGLVGVLAVAYGMRDRQG